MASILLDTGLWAVLACLSFALIVLFAILGQLFGARLGLQDPKARKTMFLLMTGLCLLLALSLVPLMVGVVLGFQEGNRSVPIIAFALDNQDDIVIVLWLLLLAGSFLALPAMMRDMRFDT